MYLLPLSLLSDAQEVADIRRAFDDYANNSCVRFVPRTTEIDYVDINSIGTPGCHSFIGRIGGPQVINYERPACLTRSVSIL
jgi:choriolysin H